MKSRAGEKVGVRETHRERGWREESNRKKGWELRRMEDGPERRSFPRLAPPARDPELMGGITADIKAQLVACQLRHSHNLITMKPSSPRQGILPRKVQGKS